MHHKRVTLRFTSDKGREYLYDDVTGGIFPWNELRESTLVHDISDLSDKMNSDQKDYSGEMYSQPCYQFIKKWRNNYGAFVRTWDEDKVMPALQADQLEQYIKNNSFELLLVLTENCNLRCKYCALSNLYPLNRKRSVRKMDLQVAKRAVDWYVSLVAPQIARNPRKLLGLSLYGGEPMLNMPVIKGILEYCRNKYPNLFLPVMTTNGTMLTPKNAETLVEHDVKIAISIDGSEQEHDRLRIDAKNKGTFKKIIENLSKLREIHPRYWDTNVTSVSVYDWGTNLESAENFFHENLGTIPRTIFVNPVSPHNTSWYTRYSNNDMINISQAMDRLREKYKKAKENGSIVSYYLDSLIGAGISLLILRQRAKDQRSGFIPFGGSCVPGDKLAIHVDGKIDMCERVNGTYPIGHLDNGGIDYYRVKEIIERYRSQVLRDCPKCPVTKHCSLCFAYVENQADFDKQPHLCFETIEEVKRRLTDYISILERNPEADFKFETDTSRLEERLLFNY